MKKRNLTFKQKLKNVLIFAIVLFLSLELLSWLLIRCGNYSDVLGNHNSWGIYAEKENTIDVAAFGSSNYYSGIQPFKMWEEHGITSYVCAEPSQRIYEMENNIKKVYRHQSPKVVVLEPNVIFKDKKNLTAMNYKLKSYAGRFIPLLTYHSKWKMLSPQRWGQWTTDMTCPSHGYAARFGKKAYKGKDWMGPSNEKEETSSLAVEELRKCIRFCKEKGSQVLLLPVPGPKEWNMKRYNLIRQIAEEEGAQLLDLNQKMDEMRLDWSKDTVDAGYHLNYWGAAKVTDYLGNFLTKNYQLEDHRNDPAYSQYQKEYDKYKEALQGKLDAIKKEADKKKKAQNNAA